MGCYEGGLSSGPSQATGVWSMLDFNREEEILREQVGADSQHILSVTSPTWADRFYLARERMSDLAGETAASLEVSIERDKLADFFGHAYGPTGLLARAGFLLTLSERMQRLVVLTPRLVADPSGMPRLRREAVLARSLTRARLGRANEGTADRALLESVFVACGSAIACADFVVAAHAVARGQGGLLSPHTMRDLADLGYLLADTSPQRPLLTVAAFALSHWVHKADDKASLGPYDAIIDAHLMGLRDTLWQATESQLMESGEPIPLAALEQADRDLETLLGRLADHSLPSEKRAQFLAQLLAMAASGRALEAQRRADTGLQGALREIADGLAAEAGVLR
ncbi:MAG: hypothetical protein HY901_23100 [Deltaproteobacteria bacterium]|nr:hypothetical protein [Deltaproteobacteria bacterium]